MSITEEKSDFLLASPNSKLGLPSSLNAFYARLVSELFKAVPSKY